MELHGDAACWYCLFTQYVNTACTSCRLTQEQVSDCVKESWARMYTLISAYAFLFTERDRCKGRTANCEYASLPLYCARHHEDAYTQSHVNTAVCTSLMHDMMTSSMKHSILLALHTMITQLQHKSLYLDVGVVHNHADIKVQTLVLQPCDHNVSC